MGGSRIRAAALLRGTAGDKGEVGFNAAHLSHRIRKRKSRAEYKQHELSPSWDELSSPRLSSHSLSRLPH